MHPHQTSHQSTTTSDSHRRAPQRGGRVRAFGAGIVASIAAAIVFATVAVDAAPVAGESTFVPITPCRLFDTRPGGDTVGPRNTPLGPGETYALQVTGSNGNCTIPAGASAIALNATAIGATHPSFATFSPSGEPRPLSSNLNYVPGQPPTPNKVDVRLSADGRIDVYNAFGRVDMLADVMGYYRDEGVDELASRLSSLEATVAALKGVDTGRLVEIEESVDDQATLLAAVVDSLPSFDEQRGTSAFLTGSFTTAADVTITADTHATVLVMSHANVSSSGVGAECAISDEAGTALLAYTQTWAGYDGGGEGVISGSRSFDVSPGTHQYRLRCRSLSPGAPSQPALTNVHLSAIEFPVAFTGPWVPIGTG